jgi:FMN phosphatase YigB (HAD superfamily)
MATRGIIFDIGRVIVRINPRRALQVLRPGSAGLSKAKAAALALGGSMGLSEAIWAKVQDDERWHDWQEGRMTPREWHERVTSRLGVDLSFEDFCAAWNSVLEPETNVPEALFSALATRYRLAVLSNTDPLHSAYLEERFSFLRYFPVRIYSCAVGASKPSPEIYLAALRALDLPAAEALYIDDVPEYVNAARQLGCDAIHFQNAAQLSAEFARRGIPAA